MLIVTWLNNPNILSKHPSTKSKVAAIWRDATGRHNDAPPEMTPAPIFSRQLATSPQILLTKSLVVADIAQETSCNTCYTMAISRPV